MTKFGKEIDNVDKRYYALNKYVKPTEVCRYSFKLIGSLKCHMCSMCLAHNIVKQYVRCILYSEHKNDYKLEKRMRGL